MSSYAPHKYSLINVIHSINAPHLTTAQVLHMLKTKLSLQMVGLTAGDEHCHGQSNAMMVLLNH